MASVDKLPLLGQCRTGAGISGYFYYQKDRQKRKHYIALLFNQVGQKQNVEF